MGHERIRPARRRHDHAACPPGQGGHCQRTADRRRRDRGRRHGWDGAPSRRHGVDLGRQHFRPAWQRHDGRALAGGAGRGPAGRGRHLDRAWPPAASRGRGPCARGCQRRHRDGLGKQCAQSARQSRARDLSPPCSDRRARRRAGQGRLGWRTSLAGSDGRRRDPGMGRRRARPARHRIGNGHARCDTRSRTARRWFGADRRRQLLGGRDVRRGRDGRWQCLVVG